LGEVAHNASNTQGTIVSEGSVTASGA
jgi:hypothetical protein